MKRYLLNLTAIIMFAFFLLGCNNDKTPVVETPEEEPITTIEEKPEAPEEPRFQHVYPLTGVPTNEEVDSRPFAVMINNHPSARPQSGLHKADIVYEVLAEGFITRYLAIFQEEYPDVVGPIRSSRPYYIDLSDGYNAIYVAYGGSTEALSKLDKGSSDYLNGIKFKNGKSSFEDEVFFYRANFRKMPHNVYMTKEKMVEGSEKRGFSLEEPIESLPFLSLDELKVLQGEKASNITVSYSKNYNVTYKFQAEKEKYTRYIGNTKSVDFETKDPIQLDTIFIVEAKHRVLDNVGRRAIDLKGGGKAILLRDGKIHHVLWQNVDGRILPFDEDGQPLSFVSGKTWINIIPTSPGIESAVKIMDN